MTALKRFQRLESPGIWRDGPEAQRRDVILSFGDASLVVSDQSEQVLTHWSLAAIERLNPGQKPALYGPAPDSAETLEIDEPMMVEAIEAVRSAIARARPHPGRLRLAILGVIATAIALLGIFWLPGALVRHAVSVVPGSVRAEIGRDLLARIDRLAGSPCARPGGQTALNRLTEKLLPGEGVHVVVLPGGMPRAIHLPGGIVVLNRALVEDYDDPAAVAGFILAERVRAQRTDPLAELLSASGVAATLRLLTSGALPDGAIEAHAERLMTAPPTPLPEPELLALFERAHVSSAAYSYARDVSGESVLRLIEADPMRGKAPMQLLSDRDWVQLQAICGS